MCILTKYNEMEEGIRGCKGHQGHEEGSGMEWKVYIWKKEKKMLTSIET